MAKEMLINVSEGEECRIALLSEDGKLDELYMERTSSTSHVGNIYKGRVTNVEPSIQAAFVDFGLGRNGFLHISDLMPTYFGRKGEDIQESVGRKMARRDRPPIQRCLRRGDEIIVQIIKEGIGTKGPTLSTYLSIPGRILVMMPGMGKMGVSKKIEDEEERRKLRTILDSLKPPKGVGFIIRTAGIGKSKTEIQRDLTYLSRLWQTIEKKRTSGPGPTELYTEGDLVTRTVRDVFSSDVDKIVVDSKEVAKRVKDVIKITAPRTKNRVEVYEEPIPLFHKYNIETDIEQMYSRHVPLPSGGSLVIDSTEAIVAIDVNSGKFRDHSDAEMTAFRTDMEAADEIPRQLKLRDLGGVIICDFIDLRYERHRRELEERLHENFKKDRAKTKVLRMSQFGIIEITRQRMRPSLKRSIYFDCPHCKGAGLVKTPESMSLDVMRRLAIGANNEKVARIELSVCPDVSFYLLNKKRTSLSALEAATKKKIIVRNDQTLGLDEMKLDLFDARDGLVVIEELGLASSQPPHTTQLGTRPHGAGRGRGGRDRGGRGGGRNQPRGGQQGGGGRHQQHAPPQPSSRDHDDRFELEETEDAAEERDERRGEPVDPALIAKIAPKIVREAPSGDEAEHEPGEAEEIDEHEREGAEGAEGAEGEPESDVIDVEDGHSSLGDRPAGEWEQRDDRGGPGGRRGKRRRGRRGGRGGGGGGGGDRAGGDRGGPQQQNRQQQPPRQQQQPRHPQQPQQRQQQPPPPKAAAAMSNYGGDEEPAAVEEEVPGPGNEKFAEGGGPGQGPGQGPGGEEGGRRRRRRRGGRRHRRRRERERMESQGGPQGQGGPAPAGLPQDDQADEGELEGERDEAESSVQDRGPALNDRDDADERDEREAEQEPETAEPVEAEAEAEVEEEPEQEEESPAPAKKKRPSRRGGKGGKGGKGGGNSGSSRRAPVRTPPKPPAKPTASASFSSSAASAPIADVPVVKTGSTDKHLVNDEPVEPQPVRRPRGRYDLDAIPDDYD